MIVKMRKLHLIAMAYERDAIFDLLHRTSAAEIGTLAESPLTSSMEAHGEELSAYFAKIDGALETLRREGESYANANKIKTEKEEDVRLTFSEFMDMGTRKEDMDALCERIRETVASRNEHLAELGKLKKTLLSASPYRSVEKPFDFYSDTASTRTRLGLVPALAWENLEKELDGDPLLYHAEVIQSEQVVLFLTAHKSAAAQAEKLLSGASFSECPYHGEMSGAQLCASLEEEIAARAAAVKEDERALFELLPRLKELKAYCDYVGYALEKEEDKKLLRATGRTFLLQAYVPAEREEQVERALTEFGSPVYFEFSDPEEWEDVPTLLKNNKVVQNFEAVTDMYSVPNARELDPNTVMGFFFSLFLGFIMADMGYGILMAVGGFYLWKVKKGTVKSLAGVFGVGGIFTAFWGVLFNSLFGIPVLPFTVMPDAQNAMYSLAGIELPSVLVIALLLGICHLCAGYLCKFAQLARRGKIWDGVFDGLVWALFSLGAGLAVVGLIEDFHLSSLTLAGGIVAGGSLAVAVLTAGRHEKLLGKFTKGFSSLYGLINYFTDVLSYIRLYGLMLTGAVIAQVIAQYTVTGGAGITPMFASGNFLLILLGVVILAAGNLFNLAISLLGAYIHTARLQYVEFFGRFYEGDGKPFTPIGTGKRYVTIAPEELKTERAA